jgi:hypothetical protein
MSDGRVKKLPLHHMTGGECNPHDSYAHTDYETARRRASDLGVQVGFVITEQDPLFFVDIDDGRPDPDSPWRPECQDIIDRFPGAFTEVSQSGTGLHIIGSSQPIEGERRCSAPAGDTSFDSLFTKLRFVALTFRDTTGHVTTDCTTAVHALVDERLRDAASGGGQAPEWTTEPRIGTGGMSDSETIERALLARSASAVFGNRASFKDLWEANIPALVAAFPDDHDPTLHDASKADAALAQHLAFWTGCNCEQIRQIMNQSALVRPKWEDRGEYYLPRTIMRACARQSDCYVTVVPVPPPSIATCPITGDYVEPPEMDDGAGPGGAPAGTLRAGLQYLTPTQQQELFRGCVYSREDHRILMPDGTMLQPPQFRAHFGGYIFSLDSQNDKTTRNAWEAFTESQAVHFPKVVGTRFSPLEPYGSVDPATGRVNTYAPHVPRTTPGDAGPFLRHLELLLPDAGDREILLSYMAACVQNVGTKFQWCPVIQGTQGNGKTALCKPLEYALGERYCHQQDPDDLTNSFNGWVEGKLMIFVEEIRTGGKRDVANRMKPLITNDRIQIHRKGVDQKTGDNRANFMMFSNYRDAVMKTQDDRRYCVLYTNQQSVRDLDRDGMTDNYFHSLYEWLRGDGCAIVAHYLLNREVTVRIDGRSPKSSSTEAAIAESQGFVEQTLLEAVDNEELGFRGGFINTKIANGLLSGRGRKMSPRGLANALNNIGYVKSGKKIQVDGERFTPYVLENSNLVGESSEFLSSAYIKSHTL